MAESLSSLDEEELLARQADLNQQRRDINDEIQEVTLALENKHADRQAELLVAAIPDGALDAVIRVGLAKAKLEAKTPKGKEE